MKSVWSITNFKKGQSLIELLIAMVIFVMAVSAISYLILDVFLSDRLGRERMAATFLAKEGLEAAGAIRDSNWDSLTLGSHGLAVVDNQWIFQGTEEDVSQQLKNGQRRIIIEKDFDRATVTAQVDWELSGSREQEVSLVTYFSNWAKFSIVDCSSFCQSVGYAGGLCRQNPMQCSIRGEVHEWGGDAYCLGGPSQDTCCCQF